MTEPLKQPTCAERVQDHWEGRRTDLKRALAMEERGGCDEWLRLDTAERVEILQECGLSPFMSRRDECPEEIPNLYEYGLSFDYVAPDTFSDQPEGFWRYQLSTGGPGDEIRFFASSPRSRCYRVEYWFLDWWDGASLDITGSDVALMLWDWFEPSIEDVDLEGMEGESYQED